MVTYLIGQATYNYYNYSVRTYATNAWNTSCKPRYNVEENVDDPSIYTGDFLGADEDE